MSKEKEFVDMLNKEMNELKTAHYTEHLEQENAQLKQQLAEKDKEIEQLRESQSITFQTLKETDAELEKYQKQSAKLRHEICENIRNIVNEYCRYDYDLMGWHLTEEKLENLLEEIKRGK